MTKDQQYDFRKGIILSLAQKMGVEKNEDHWIKHSQMHLEEHRFHFFSTASDITISHGFDTHYSNFPMHSICVFVEEARIVLGKTGQGVIEDNLQEIVLDISLYDPDYEDKFISNLVDYIVDNVDKIEKTGVIKNC